jgi:phage shock protein A
LFKNVGKAIDAKADEKASKIAEENMVEFGKQDIQQMESDLRTIKNNIGSIKGEIVVLEDNLKDIKNKIEKHDSDALALSETGKNDLAEQHVSMSISLEKQAESLSQALESQKSVLNEQIKNKNDLASSLQQAQADLVTIKAMTDAAKANEKLAQVSTASGTNALASFRERQEAAKKRLIKSQSLKEENSCDSDLEKATNDALGSSVVKDRLAMLKSKTK